MNTNNRYEVVIFGENSQDETIVDTFSELAVAIHECSAQTGESIVFDTHTQTALFVNN